MSHRGISTSKIEISYPATLFANIGTFQQLLKSHPVGHNKQEDRSNGSYNWLPFERKQIITPILGTKHRGLIRMPISPPLHFLNMGIDQKCEASLSYHERKIYSRCRSAALKIETQKYFSCVLSCWNWKHLKKQPTPQLFPFMQMRVSVNINRTHMDMSLYAWVPGYDWSLTPGLPPYYI